MRHTRNSRFNKRHIKKFTIFDLEDVNKILQGPTRGLAFQIQKRFHSTCGKKRSAAELIEITERCVASNYCPLPFVIDKGKGVVVYDVQGKSYLDFLSGFSALSLGHAHPKMCKAIFDQVKVLTHTSRHVFTKALAEYGEFITELFCKDKVLPMNSGNEACETAVKLARKWGYKMKKVPVDQAKVVFVENNSWGSSIAAISATTKSELSYNYGPFVPGFETVPFNNVSMLAEKLKEPEVCAFVVEPIMGDAGVLIPDPCYLKEVRRLCDQYKVLMIADEVMCGLGRCGSLLVCDIYNVRPDVIVLGKALSGGYAPVSAVLADTHLMDVIEPNTHLSTFGGNPLSCKIAMTALKILQSEKLIENSKKMGEIFRESLCDLPKDIVCEVRGIGLLNAIVINSSINTSEVCRSLMKSGLLTAANNDTIRFSPPLTVKENEIAKAVKIIRHCIENSRGLCGS